MDDRNIQIFLNYTLKRNDKKHYLGVFTITSFNTLNIKKKKKFLNIIH